MQTFLPYPDFEKTVKCLDWRRLGKQRVEAMQIHNIITGKSNKKGWINHPAVRMWRGFHNALATYHNFCIYEWIDRGYNNNMKIISYDDKMILPPWFGRRDFHSAHRQTLLFKDFKWYFQFGWKEEPKYEYVWPV
jgi:hypothetical protein